jgi:Flp pilus assembly protein TadG
MRRLKSLIKGEDGTELVEFAIAVTFFLTMIFGVVESCLAMFGSNFVAMAAQEGTRYAMVRGSDWINACTTVTQLSCAATSTNVTNYILAQPHPGMNLTASNITVTWMTTNAAGNTCAQYAQGCQVKVKVSYTYPLQIPFVSASWPLSSTSIETIQD